VPTSVREAGVSPWQQRISTEPVRSLVDRELAAADGGTVAVIGPASRFTELRRDVGEDERVSLLTVEEAKGLEFDGVVVVAPEEIAAESPRGWNDLYVALTRATRRLGIVYTRSALAPLVGAG
jgi:superfamily I DNA/RNA helicase